MQAPVCYKTCIKKKFLSKKCKTWAYDVQDLAKPEVYNNFRAGNFVFINEGKL